MKTKLSKGPAKKVPVPKNCYCEDPGVRGGPKGEEREVEWG